MAMKGLPLEQWRGYFLTANSDIFDIIDHAIMVAALDCPKEFRVHRDRIAEKLFTCKFTRCLGCDRVELVVPEYEDGDGNARAGGCHTSFKREAEEEFEAGGSGSKESKANSRRDDSLMNQIASNYSYGEAEALTNEFEQESMIVDEVFRIKEILHNYQDEPDSVLVESLRKLQLMVLTVNILEATGIGKAVNRVRKHSSKQIRNLAQTLIDGWKELVDEWVNATKAVAGVTPESVNPSVGDEVEEEEEEEDEFPFPPLDVGALFATQPTSMDLSQFFDGMDDDGNPQNSVDVVNNRNCGRKPLEENHNFSKQKLQTSSANLLTKDDKRQQMKRQEPVAKPNNKPSSTDVGIGRSPKHDIEQKAYEESKLEQKPDMMAAPKKPLRNQHKLNASDEAQKLEATKRKLQERYQQVENAKRKRTVQMMELHDLPKQGSGHKNPYSKHGNHNRQLANRRR